VRRFIVEERDTVNISHAKYRKTFAIDIYTIAKPLLAARSYRFTLIPCTDVHLYEFVNVLRLLYDIYDTKHERSFQEIEFKCLNVLIEKLTFTF